jgi:uncharacterized damage-inducible protein DinB
MNPPTDRESVLARYKEGPLLLERALAGLRDGDLDVVPSNGAWTIRQIVHHVADGDDIWKLCIKQALGNEQADFTLAWYWEQPQTVWADRWAYTDRSVDVSVRLLKANREHVSQLLEQVPDSWSRSVAIRQRDGGIERVTVGTVVEMQADHVVHHVNRILSIREKARDA